MPYIDWEYYSSLYANVPKDEFPALLQKASSKLDVYTHMRARKFEDVYDEVAATYFQKRVHTQIRNTVCDLINALYMQESTGMGTGVSSVSNDGYSESYKITTVAEKEAQLLSITRSGLSGTGLAGAL
nr:MAG TPA: Head Tail Connector Protein [Caudoviricetes sp.]